MKIPPVRIVPWPLKGPVCVFVQSYVVTTDTNDGEPAFTTTWVHPRHQPKKGEVEK